MQHESDKYNYQGKEFQFVGFDEATQFTQTQYLYLFSRARSTNPGIPPRIRATTNPGGVGHVWCKERFIDIGPFGQPFIDPDTGLSRVFIPARYVDNPSLFAADPDYINRLKMLPDIEQKRLLEGEWDSFENQAFPELSARVHSCEPFQVPHEWEKFCCLDWGYAKPFSVGWYALDFNGVLYRYREYYGCKDNEADKGLRMTAIELARGIIERETEKVRFRVADPACWSQIVRRDGTLGPSVIEDMGREGIYFLKADNARILGKLQVHQRLRLETETNDEGEVISEFPQFMAFSDQKHFWRTMTQLRLDEKNPEDVETDQQEDHCIVGETMIMTDRGAFPIAELSGKTGRVLTIGGNWTDFYDCRKTAINKDLVKVTFENGDHVFCTPDHKFLTYDGRWVEAKNLHDALSYVSISKTVKEDDSICKSMSSTRPHRNLTDEGTGYADSIFNEKERGFISRYGSTIGVRSFQRDMKFTTRIMIELIIRSIIWKSRNLLATVLTMPQSMIMENGLMLCIPEPQSGMAAIMGSSGIGNITKSTAGGISLSAKSRNANNAANRSMVSSDQDFAPMSASLNGGEIRDWTENQDYARYAEKNSRLIDTQNKLLAQEIAEQSSAVKKGLRVKRVDPAGKADVFCLVADRTHSFALHNGVIISNCYDEFRYACMSRPIRPKVQSRAPQGTFQAERTRMIKARKYAERHGVSMSVAYSRVR